MMTRNKNSELNKEKKNEPILADIGNAGSVLPCQNNLDVKRKGKPKFRFKWLTAYEKDNPDDCISEEVMPRECAVNEKRYESSYFRDVYFSRAKTCDVLSFSSR
jgi:hypothetical protein